MTQTLTFAVDQTRRLSRFLLVAPLAFITYGLAFLDRVNYASASTRLESSLKISGWLPKLVAASFFLGYFLFQIPGASYAANRSVKRLVFWALILWGILSGLTGVIHSIPLLLIDRMLLGVVEGVVLPAMLIFLTRWFTKDERSRVNSVLMIANPFTMLFASVLCGFLIDFFDHHRVGHWAGWQMMFIVEGVPSLIWAVVWLLTADEEPADASWLNSQEIQAVQTVLEAEQRELKHVKNYWAAFADVRVVKLSGFFFCMCIASYGIMMWLPTIVENGTHASASRSGLLMGIPYFLAIVTMVITSIISDKTLQRKPFVVGALFIGSVALTVSYLAGKDHFWIAFAGLSVAASCIYIPCPPLWAWMTEMLPRNVVGESMALVNSAGALGGFTGTFVVGMLIEHFHSSGPGYIFQACALAIAGMLTLLVPANIRTPSAFPVIMTVAAVGQAE